MKCCVFLCKDTNKLLFFKKLRLLLLKISDVNKSILVFKFGMIKSSETLSYLSIDICIVTCGRQVGICIVSISHPRLSLYSDPDRVVLHQAELMHLIATVSTLRHFYIRNSEYKSFYQVLTRMVYQ